MKWKNEKTRYKIFFVVKPLHAKDKGWSRSRSRIPFQLHKSTEMRQHQTTKILLRIRFIR
jgi:hypothetical protein